MNLYDIAIARKLSGGGGGGGSSDMYTAEVSVIASNGYSFYPLNFESSKIIGVANDENNGLTDYMSEEGVPFIFSSGNEDFTWYILNNESIYLISQGSIFSVSGSAEVIDTDEIEFVRIYGDCTITIN